MGCVVIAELSVAGGCSSRGARVRATPLNATLLVPLNLDQPAQPKPASGTIDLLVAKNETVGFALQVGGLPAMGGRPSRKLRFVAPQEIAQAGAWQILTMPVDLNQAGYV